MSGEVTPKVGDKIVTKQGLVLQVMDWPPNEFLDFMECREVISGDRYTPTMEDVAHIMTERDFQQYAAHR